MWMTKDGDVKEFDERVWSAQNLQLKGWTPCDAPAPVPDYVPTYQDKRSAEYAKQGLTIDVLITTLWDSLQEPSAANSQAVADIQTKRAVIKAQFPAK